MSTKDEELISNVGSEEKYAHKPNFSGVWQHVRSDNLDAFLKATGVNWFMRKVAVRSDPIYTIFHEDEVIRIIFSNGGTSRETVFVIDEEYDEMDWNDRPMRVKVYWDEDSLVELHEPTEWGNGTALRVTKFLRGFDLLIFVLELGDVTCRRYFRKQLATNRLPSLNE
ncbi:hypothetical protein CAPTEDRAFT_221624 [Capitella teleta]|uniref:Lipocalin/cytosolic fatty-acid binding domain-containing protein n=1 Tax=Capitella teleta TaxID=283909 RepID=R7UKX2_CAPTE|nr:hypothetical protein CAPTEDRAFT_221624 [Capitella teleta]|eukprot:ELU06753.1 hypothetical protein CAPTEDRAFT_221624 [Capitella teleta]